MSTERWMNKENVAYIYITQPKLTDEWIKKMWCVYIYNSAKIDRWMNKENVVYTYTYINKYIHTHTYI